MCNYIQIPIYESMVEAYVRRNIAVRHPCSQQEYPHLVLGVPELIFHGGHNAIVPSFFALSIICTESMYTIKVYIMTDQQYCCLY
jgi:hypothetical protein